MRRAITVTVDAVLEEARAARRYLYPLGMPEPAIAALERMLGEATDEAIRTEVAGLLLDWYARRQQAASTRPLDPLFALAASPEGDRDHERRLAILRSRHLPGDQAVALLEAQLAEAPHADLMLARANLAPPEARVDWLNRALALHQLDPVELAVGDLTPFDRLRPAHPAQARADGPLVSVIVPLFNSADTIATALASLTWQSWTNIEILVADDASTDDSVAVVREAARSDPRIRLLLTQENRGAYVSRNRALLEAKGTFVTVHDADDWSHPAKIERQVDHLLANAGAIANMSTKARTHPALEFVALRPAGVHLAENASSLLFRREAVVAALGSWDSVRVGADTEFIRRLESRFGAAAVVTLQSGPISLQRRSPGSLTGSGALAYPGFSFGAREEYGESSHWYRKQFPDRLNFPFPMTERPYPAPAQMLPERSAGTRRYDIVIASDFRLATDANIANLEEIEANAALGLRTGLVQLSVFDLTAPRRRHPWLMQAVQSGLADVLVFGDRISCDLLIVRDPRVLVEDQLYIPEVEANGIRVVVDRPPLDAGQEGGRRTYDAAQCDAHVEGWFGRKAIWHPTNPQTREALVAQGVSAAVRLSEEDWPETVTLPGFVERSPRVAGKAIRIGRHGSDHASDWPSTAEEIQATYPARKGVRVSILGSADPAILLLGELPSNWKVSKLKRREQEAAFFDRIDAYVRFGRENTPQYDRRGILASMLASVPVLLGEAMRDAFAGLASFARPQDAGAHLDKLMGDDEATGELVAGARRFVERVHGREAYAARLKPLAGGAPTAKVGGGE